MSRIQTVIRVKRRREEDPLASLVLGPPENKKRCGALSTSTLPKVFSFVGSVPADEADDLSGVLKDVLNTDLEAEAAELPTANAELLIAKWNRSLRKQKESCENVVVRSQLPESRGVEDGCAASKPTSSSFDRKRTAEGLPQKPSATKLLHLPDGSGVVNVIDLARVFPGPDYSKGVGGVKRNFLDSGEGEESDDEQDDYDCDVYAIDSTATQNLTEGGACWQLDIMDDAMWTDEDEQYRQPDVAFVEVEEKILPDGRMTLDYFLEDYGDVDDPESDSENDSVDYPSSDEDSDVGPDAAVSDNFLFGNEATSGDDEWGAGKPSESSVVQRPRIQYHNERHRHPVYPVNLNPRASDPRQQLPPDDELLAPHGKRKPLAAMQEDEYRAQNCDAADFGETESLCGDSDDGSASECREMPVPSDLVIESELSRRLKAVSKKGGSSLDDRLEILAKMEEEWESKKKSRSQSANFWSGALSNSASSSVARKLVK